MMDGLTTEAARAYQRAHGYNEIREKKTPLWKKALKRVVSPISLMLLIAAILSYVSGKLFDGGFILILLVINLVVTLWQERKADTAIERLNEHLATSVRALRDGSWKALPSRELVPGDVIELKAGVIIPADAEVREANAASASEAALTGESLPKDKKVGDTIYSGSYVASGLITAQVSATGERTSFGKTITRIDTSEKRSSLEQQILRISQLLSGLSIVAVLILTWLLIRTHASLIEIIRLDLSLVIAGIPISLPTVMTLIIALGVVELSKKGVVVRRLSALEELADTDYLLTDKTGTLTKDSIGVDSVISYSEHSDTLILSLAATVAKEEPDSTIDRALIKKATPTPFHISKYVPVDSLRKRATATGTLVGKTCTLTLGAPQVVESLCSLSAEDTARFERDVEDLAKRGYRSLALARGDGGEERDMQLLGLIALSDEVRSDAGEVIRFLDQNGVGISMVTGDNAAIAAEIAEKLQIPGARVMTPASKPSSGWMSLTKEAFDATAAFAEILPEDKLELVRSAKRFYTVASNGDGINDLPAVREASVGFAVKNAVDALKGAADIVLLSDGISVMRDAFLEGRKIFMRLYAYSVYRVSESFRLIITIAILGFLVGTYPLSPLQLILIALLNDVPIISLAGNRVKVARRPSKFNIVEQFSLSILYGLVGVVNSLLLYLVALDYLMLPLPVVETMFFLKLTVSGHFLIYVAHTKERWWRYMPSMSVITATAATQIVATMLALTGYLMPAALPWHLVIFVWAWSFFFMQMSELVKWSRTRHHV